MTIPQLTPEMMAQWLSEFPVRRDWNEFWQFNHRETLRLSFERFRILSDRATLRENLHHSFDSLKQVSKSISTAMRYNHIPFFHCSIGILKRRDKYLFWSESDKSLNRNAEFEDLFRFIYHHVEIITNLQDLCHRPIDIDQIFPAHTRELTF